MLKEYRSIHFLKFQTITDPEVKLSISIEENIAVLRIIDTVVSAEQLSRLILAIFMSSEFHFSKLIVIANSKSISFSRNSTICSNDILLKIQE